MAQQTTLQEELVRFSRVIALLFNRATIYQSSHPYVKQTIDDFSLAIEKILKDISPLVFIMNHDQLFLDEQPFTSGTNIGRIVAHFKKTGIESISFFSGLSKNELRTFLEVFTALNEYPNADAMKKALVIRGIRHIKINHVFFKKVTQDDEVISRDALKDLTPDVELKEQSNSKLIFVDMVLGSLLAEELRETLTLETLLKSPAEVSRKMSEADVAIAGRRGEQDGGPGLVLMQELEILGEEVGKSLLKDENVDLSAVAAAVFEMKKRLMENMEAQKALNVTYANESMILDKVNEITDNVVLEITKHEYQAGKVAPSRLAQIVRRLVPEPAELKRLLPKIRAALLEEGMTLSGYLTFAQELGKELQSEDLVKLFQESSEELGIDGEALLEEIKRNPANAAELIFLASEMRKGSGDEQALAGILIDYVERLGNRLMMDCGEANEIEGEQHLREVVRSIESCLIGRLKDMDVQNDLLQRLEERFSQRIDEILEKVKLDWIRSRSIQPDTELRKELTVLELLEQSVSEGDDLSQILEIVRVKVEAHEMDENDFGQIFAEITRQQNSLKEETEKRMPKGVFRAPAFSLLVEKEIARAERYSIPFSALSFSLVRAVPKSVGPSGKISYHGLMAAVFEKILAVARGSDIVCELGRNKIAVLLPMTSGAEAQLALRRYMKLLYGTSVEVEGTSLTIRLAGVSTGYGPVHAPNADAFLQVLSNELAQMEKRIKNIQAYF